jgi:flagellar hook-associated protein 3 FlgL
MAMRITTKMMQNTSLRNLNTNKTKQDDLTNQLATGKKISRPSDDPVVAIRSLKLNSTLDKIDQYYEKNAEDAESWLDLTASAISTVNDILSTTMKPNINQACNSYQEASDRQAIITNLQQAISEIYSTGNADSGGRSIFTGYRTDMSLTIQADTTQKSTITEQLTNADIGTKTFVATGDLKEINEGNFMTIANQNGNTEYNVTTNEVYRIRLAYSDIDVTEKTDANGNVVTDANGNIVYDADFSLQTYDSITDKWTDFMDGTAPKYVFATGTDEAYQTAINNNNAIVYIADTGEILLGSDVQKNLSELSSDTEIRVTYDKTEWKKDDLDPVHYFYTVKTVEENGKDKQIEYNANFLDDPTASGKQIIEYDIGNNQSIRVNTTADEVFTHDMGRDAEEVIEMLNEYSSVDDALTNVQTLIDSEKYADGSAELTALETQKSALEKAKTYIGDKINKRCSALLTDCDNYAERTQLAETNCGSRGTRLTLIQNRLSVQQTNFEELVSENEDADYTDLAIQLKSVEMTYEAALSSISYVMQTTLLDFI